MKTELMDYIVCPDCKKAFTLQIFEQEGSEITEGLIKCESCGFEFPIIRSIPRILPGELLHTLVTGYWEFAEKHHMKDAEKRRLAAHDTDETIAKGFEFEWQHHSEVLPEHEKEFRHVLGEVIKPEELDGKVVLDAGCGQGRFSYFSAKYGAKTVIGFDLGEQVLIARQNTKAVNNIHLLQASIYEPPFENIFDQIFSIGVIHHLPDPEKGFRSLYNLLKKEGKIFIWVYGYSSIIPIIKFIRQFTLGKSLKFNRFLAWFIAVPLYLLNQFYVVLKKIPGMSGLAEKIPWHMYYDRGFSNVWTIVFDKMNSAIANYYRKEDLQGWLDRLADKQAGVLDERYPGESGSSWRLMAQK